MTAALIRRASIEELCAHRDRALSLYAQGIKTLGDAMKAHAEACPGRRYSKNGDILSEYFRYTGGRAEETQVRLRESLDRDMWSSLIDYTRIGSLMDRVEREKLQKSMEESPPEVTPANANATFERLVSEAQEIFRRGLVNAFARFCRDYKSNDGFKIGERIVIEGAVTFDKLFGFRLNHYREPELQDLDRVVHILDGKEAPEHRGATSLVFQLREALHADRDGNGDKTLTTPYWRMKWFKKGTVHLWMLDDELRIKANRLIAEHFGETLGAGHGVAAKDKVDPQSYAGKFGADDQGWFPTPPDLAREIVRLAEIEPDMTVLEPSAGEGALALVARSMACSIRCFEIDRQRRSKLEADGFYVQSIENFLDAAPYPIEDRVIMNPPFEKQQDILHVMHAFQFLKPGGRLVAIMSAGTRFRTTALNVAFDALFHANQGRITNLPDDSFKESGTSVRACIVIMDKPL